MTSRVGRVGEPEPLPRLGPRAAPVERRDLAPQRHPGDGGVRQPGAGEGDPDTGGEAGAEPVGQAGPGVLLVDDDRRAAAPGSEVGRGRDVAAEADDDLGAGAVDGVLGGTHRAAQVGRQPQQVTGGTPRERHLGHLEQRVAALGHEPRLQPGGGAQGGDDHVGVAAAQAVGQGEQRRDVPGGAATREEHRPGARRGHARVRRARATPGMHGERAAQGRRPRRQRLGTPGFGAGEGQQDAEREHARDERGPARRHQRQRHPDDGEQADDGADVDERLDDDPGHDRRRWRCARRGRRCG